MASLTHVCMWSNDGWKQITAEKAAQLHPGGKVSAHSGLFMCELCGQYVLLTDGKYQVRHFRHSSHEKSKNCPERTFGPAVSIAYNPIEHELPIRIVDITSKTFHFELGLLRVPKSMLHKNMQVEINPLPNNNKAFIYNKERLNINGITYVYIGEIPYKQYKLNIKNGNEKIYEYWPREISGFNPYGTLFEANSGRKLLDDSDVEIGKEYYYLTNQRMYSNFESMDMTVKKISEKKSSMYSCFYLYSITANSMNENAAKFFLEHHYRLTDRAITIQPIWPLYVQGSFVIKHNQDSVLLHIKGNATSLKSFPQTSIKQLLHTTSSKLYKVNCQNRQQLLSTGRIKALQYTYFWREPITHENNSIEYSVKDIDGNEIAPGKLDKIPVNGALLITSNCDGELIIKDDDLICEKRKICADKVMEIDKLSIGKSVLLYIGLDCVWELTFNKNKKNDNFDSLFSDIINSKGPTIKTPHSLKNIAISYRAYPQFYKWIIKCIKQGEMYENAFRKIEKAYIQRKSK